MKVQGTRVEYGAKGPAAKDERSGDLKQGSSVSDVTNAKVTVSGVQNEAREMNSKAAPATRKTSSAE